MQQRMIIQGGAITSADIEVVRRLIADHPDWHRTRLSKELRHDVRGAVPKRHDANFAVFHQSHLLLGQKLPNNPCSFL